EAVARIDVLRIERHRRPELVFHLRRVRGGAEHATLLRLGGVRTAQKEMRLGAPGRLRDGLFEEADRGVAVAAAESGAPLVDQWALREERCGGEPSEETERKARGCLF